MIDQGTIDRAAQIIAQHMYDGCEYDRDGFNPTYWASCSCSPIDVYGDDDPWPIGPIARDEALRYHGRHIAQVLAAAGLLADPIAAAVAAQERDELTRDRDSWRRIAENLYQRAEQADETNQRLNRRAQIAESAINELVTGTGRGKCRPVALEIWERCQENHAARCDSGVGCHHPDPCPDDPRARRGRLTGGAPGQGTPDA